VLVRTVDAILGTHRGRQTMIEREPSRLEQILAKYGQRWQIERDGPVWMATEHPSPTAHCMSSSPTTWMH
jgi:hypothetical protein